MWLDHDYHLALLDSTDPARYDIYYVVAFTMFLRDMSMLSDLWFDLNVDWLDYESHLAYMDSANIERHDITYVRAYMAFLRTCGPVPEAVTE